MSEKEKRDPHQLKFFLNWEVEEWESLEDLKNLPNMPPKKSAAEEGAKATAPPQGSKKSGSKRKKVSATEEPSEKEVTSSSSSTKTKAKKSTKEKKAANRDKNPATSNGQPEKRKKNDENEQLNNTIAAMSDDQLRARSEQLIKDMNDAGYILRLPQNLSLDVKKIALQRAETEYDYIKEHDKRVRLKPVEGCTIRKHRVNKTDGESSAPTTSSVSTDSSTTTAAATSSSSARKEKKKTEKKTKEAAAAATTTTVATDVAATNGSAEAPAEGAKRKEKRKRNKKTASTIAPESTATAMSPSPSALDQPAAVHAPPAKRTRTAAVEPLGDIVRIVERHLVENRLHYLVQRGHGEYLTVPLPSLVDNNPHNEKMMVAYELSKYS